MTIGTIGTTVKTVMAGNVGIGLTAPTAVLDVNGAAKIRGALDLSTNNITNANQISATTNLVLQPTSGNVGIGTSAPGYTLDVSGSVKCNSIISSRFKLYDIEYRMVSWASGFSSNQFTTGGGSIIFFFSYSRYSEAISSKTDTIQLRQAGTNTVIATYTYIFYFNSANFHIPASFSRIYPSLTAGTYYFYCSTNATTNADVNVMNISAIEFPF